MTSDAIKGAWVRKGRAQQTILLADKREIGVCEGSATGGAEELVFKIERRHDYLEDKITSI